MEDAQAPEAYSDDQYKLAWAFHSSFSTMMWQTPALGITAQAFLLAQAFASRSLLISVIVCVAAVLIGMSTRQLFCKHRQFEFSVTKDIERYEKINNLLITHGRAAIERSGLAPGVSQRDCNKSSFDVWRRTLSGFIILDALMLLIYIFWATCAVIEAVKCPVG